MHAFYGQVFESTWADAVKLHATARKLGLNKSENLDRVPIERPTWDERKQRKTLEIPKGYSRHLRANSRREKYNNGYWLGEKVFADVLEYSGLDRAQLERLYYTGQIEELCTFLAANTKSE